MPTIPDLPRNQTEQREQRHARLESFFEGLDTIEAKLDPGTRSEFQKVVSMALDPAEARAQAVNKAYVTAMQPQAAEAVQTQWATVRQQVAESLGIQKPEVSDVELYGAFSASIKQRNERREQVGEVLVKIQEAGYTGDANWLETYQKASASIPDLTPDEKDQLRGQAERLFIETRTKAAAVAPAIQAGVSYYQQAAAGVGDMDAILEARTGFRDALMALPEEQRGLALAWAIDRAATSIEQTRAAGGTAGGLEKAVITLERAIGAVPRAVVSGFRTAVQETKNTEALRLDRQIDEGLAQAVDPVKSRSRLVQGVYDALGSVPYMATAMIPWAGIPLTISAMSDDNRARYEAEGMDTAEATALGLVAAVPQAMVERLQGKLLFKGSAPGLTKWLKAPAAGALPLLRKAALNAGVQIAGQNIEEAVQDFTPLVVQEVASMLSDSIPGVNWDKQLAAFASSRVDTFFALLPLALIGAGGATFSSPEAVSLVKDRKLLRAAGLTEDGIAKVMKAKTPEATEAALREEWENRPEVPAETATLDRAMEKEAAQAQQVKQQADGSYAVMSPEGQLIDTVATPEAAAELLKQHERAAAQQATITANDDGSFKVSSGDGSIQLDGLTDATQAQKLAATLSSGVDNQAEAVARLGEELKTLDADKPGGIISGSAAEKWADEVLKRAGAQVSSGLDPELFAAYTVKGAAVIERGVRDFASWSAEMVGKFGENIRPHLEEIYEGTKEYLKTHRKYAAKLAPQVFAEITSDLRKRRVSERVENAEGAAAVFDPEVRVKMQNTQYTALGLGEIQHSVHSILSEGVEKAQAKFNDRASALSMPDRVGIGLALSEHYNALGEFDTAAEYVDKVAELGTELGQSINVFKLLGQMLDTPEKAQAYIARERRKLNKPVEPPPGMEEPAIKRPKIPPLTDEQNKKLAELAQRVGRTPPGSIFRVDATLDLMAYAHELLKGVSGWDLAWSIWYGNILSGYNTHIRNISGNAFELISTGFLDTWTANPGQWFERARNALFGGSRGFLSGIAEGKEHLKTGKGVIGRADADKFGAPDALEQHTFAGGKANPYNYVKYVKRALVAEDAVGFHTAYELKSIQSAAEIARAEGLKGKAAEDRVAQILNQTDEQQETFQERAEKEWNALKAGDVKATREQFITRRVRELTQMERDGKLVERATDFANRVTFNYKPEGLLGIVAEAIGTLNRGLADDQVVGRGATGKALKGISQATRLLVPFTRVVANVTNRQLDYALGVPRSMMAATFVLEGGRVVLREKSSDVRAIELRKGIVGVLGAAGIAAAFWPDDEDKKLIKIHGSGPGSFGAQQQLRSLGWQPWSIQIGERFYAFRYLPIGILLASIGEVHDASRYQDRSDNTALQKAGFALSAAGAVTLDASFLSNLADFMSALNQRDDAARGKALESFMQRTFGADAALPFSSLVQNITSDMDEFDRDRSGASGFLASQVPIAQLQGQPAINLLGDPVQNRFLEAFVGRPKTDEEGERLFRLLAEKEAWFSSPSTYRNKMEPEQFYEFQKVRGALLKAALIENETAIAQLASEDAQALVRRLNDFATAQAKQQVNYSAPDKRKSSGHTNP